MATAGTFVRVAFADGPLEPTPTWTDIDETVKIARWETHTGRQSELDRTDTGTASFVANDTAGALDPSNAGGPWFGTLDGRQVSFGFLNPFTDTWHTRFRGHLADYATVVDPSLVKTVVQVPAVDLFDYLERLQVAPGIAGFTPPAGSEGNVFYEEAAVDDRILAALGDASIPPELYRIFSGNVSVMDTIYEPGDSILSIIRDAADAEFPGVANLFVDCDGVFTFHGRLARFNPAEPTYDIDTWYAGDGTQCALDPTYAQIRALSFSRPQDRIINLALAYPDGIADVDIEAQLVSDTTSYNAYGPRYWTATDLLTLHDNLLDLDGNAATLKFSEYYVDNFKDPRTTVNQIQIKSVRPDDPRAEATWGLLSGVNISDIVHITTTNPGGGGFDEDFYIEGLAYEVEPLNPDFPLVTLTLNVSPKAYYGTNPWAT